MARNYEKAVKRFYYYFRHRKDAWSLKWQSEMLYHRIVLFPTRDPVMLTLFQP
jgi:hypothetical protein